jgi:two-component system, chemotaxis family, response regulator PixG
MLMKKDTSLNSTANLQRSIISKLNYLSWGEFTGSASITTPNSRSWNLLFYQGRLVWGVDRQQPNRFWQRHLHLATEDKSMTIDLMWQTANEVNPTAFALNSDSCWQYQGAIALWEIGKLSQRQLSRMLSASSQEVIFDILQASHHEKLIIQTEPEIFLDRPPILLNTEKVINAAQTDWEEWVQNKLVDISPLLAPKIEHPVQLYRQTTPIVYQNLARAIDGERTLREMAIELNQDLLLLTRSLCRYVPTGIIKLTELGDLEIAPIVNPTLPPNFTPSAASKIKLPSQLIACIDDNKQICQQMDSIITEAGYRCLTIQEATRVLPRLLEKKPDLIFLDLIMPQTNGYELCTQIRKVSVLSRTPIIIITGRDGLMDRVRAKMVGASDFITKPIDRHKIESLIDKYLKTSAIK